MINATRWGANQEVQYTHAFHFSLEFLYGAKFLVIGCVRSQFYQRRRKLRRFIVSSRAVDVRILWLWGLDMLPEKICVLGEDMGLVSIFCAFIWSKISVHCRELNLIAG